MLFNKDTHSNFELISDILQILLTSNSSLFNSDINELASGKTENAEYLHQIHHKGKAYSPSAKNYDAHISSRYI